MTARGKEVMDRPDINNTGKLRVAVDISSTGKGGGPYTSTMNLIHSPLRDKVDYRIFEYKTETGRFISIKRIKDLASQLKAIEPDIVHFTGLQLSGFHVAVASRLAGVEKSIVVIHGSSTEAMNIGRLKRAMLYFLEWLTLALTTTYYGVSEYSSRLPVTRPHRKKSSGYVYNLPPSKDLSAGYTKGDLGFGEDDIVVVSVARITRDKGYHVLAEAIEKFGGHPSVKFLIVGEGDYLPEMKQRLAAREKEGKVVFTGYRSDIVKILKGCDIFVLPTLHETLSISLLEASRCSLPLVASDVGGVPEVVETGVNGILVPPADPESIVGAVTLLAGDRMLRARYGAGALAKLEEKFDPGILTGKIWDIYEMLSDR